MAVNKIKILTGMGKKSNNLHTFNANMIYIYIYIRLPVLLAIQVLVEKYKTILRL